MEAKMRARSGKLVLAASLALAPGLLLAQDRAVPRGGGDGGGGSRGGGSSAGESHPGPSTSSSGSSSSGSSYSPSSGGSGGSSYSGGGSTAERRHPRAGTGTGSNYYPGYGYPGYPGYPGYYPGYPGWGAYYPGYWGYWWPYASYGYGWYGGGYGYPGGTVYYSHSGGGEEAGSVRVLVDPAEARVYVDGYYAGVVDDFDGLFQRLHVSPGRHDISLKLEGYTTHRVRVYVGPDATLKLHYDLQRGNGETFEDLSNGAPPPPEREVRREQREPEDDAEPTPGEQPSGEHLGQLHLRVEPADASVYIDGAFRGTGREAGTLRLPPGRHRIEVVRPGYRTTDQEIEVAPGETTQLSVTLERPSI
jgi:PEGA domain-containing protein